MNTTTTTNAPTLFNNMVKETMSSLEIAEVTGKNHAHIMRDIRKLLTQGVNKSNFGLVEYTDKKGEQRPCYELTKNARLCVGKLRNLSFIDLTFIRKE